MDKKNVQNVSVLETIEKERQRIARGLHDDVVQNLIYLSQQTEIVQKYLNKDICAANLELEEMKINLKTIISELRNTIYDLRPMSFDDLGWKSAFSKLRSDMKAHNDWNVFFDIDTFSDLDQIVLITIYRIVREACANAKKHSTANNLWVNVKQVDNNVSITIIDDGIGYDANSIIKEKHFGLKEIQDSVVLLNGTLTIDSDKGTHIEILIPMHQEEKND